MTCINERPHLLWRSLYLLKNSIEMNVVCSFSATNKAQHSGFGLVECLISLMILSTSILMVMSIGLRQIQQSRETLLQNQLYQQIDSLCFFIYQHPQNASMIIDSWKNQFTLLFPQAKTYAQFQEKKLVVDIEMQGYSLKVIANGMCSKKTLTRHDAR